MNISNESASSSKIQSNQSIKVVSNENITVVANFGPEHQILKCPYCHSFVNTRIKSKISVKTHLCALLMGVCGCWICFGCPYCKQSCKSAYHYCPECRSYLGSYHY